MQPQDVLWVLIVALGLRLVWQGAAQRSSETVLGLAIILWGAGAATIRRAMEPRDIPLATVALALITLGTVFMAWFTQLVFHPGSARARGVVVACVVMLGAGLWHQLEGSGLGTGQLQLSLVMSGSRAVVMGWAALEALRFRRQYMRRAVLGVVDPVVANRFALFSVWTLLLAVLPILTQVMARVAAAEGNAELTQILVPARVLGAVCLVSIFLTFLPPPAYLRYVKARAAGKAVVTP